MSSQEAAPITVGTLNLRNTSDRWKARAPLLIEQLVRLQPDVIGLQEVRVPVGQAQWIVEQVNAGIGVGGSLYELFQTSKTGLAGRLEGIAIMSRLPFEETEWLGLGGGHRVAQRARLRLPSGQALNFCNTHLHHERDASDLRLEQARRILAWLGEQGGLPVALVGDFNAKPEEPAVQLILGRLRSAFARAHGREPAQTAPTPLSDEWGREAHVIDYIFVSEDVDVLDAWTTFDRTGDGDPRLCASDHYGIAAKISLSA